MNTKLKIASCFNRAVNSYDSAAVLQVETCSYLQQKMQHLAAPEIILDVGCGTGNFLTQLKSIFPDTRVLALDIAENMLRSTALKGKPQLLHSLCADFDHIPLQNQSIDLIFSNLALQWSPNLELTFNEMRRVLKHKGQMMFSLVAENSLRELKQCYQLLNIASQVNDFYTQAHVANSLLHNNFKIIEVGIFKQTYFFADIYCLLNSLKAIGANHVIKQPTMGLRGKDYFKKLESVYQVFMTAQGLLPVSYDIIYAVVEVY